MFHVLGCLARKEVGWKPWLFSDLFPVAARSRSTKYENEGVSDRLE